MTTACVAIIFIVLISSYMCTRKGYATVGRSFLPSAFVPAGHIIGTEVIVRFMKAARLLKEIAAAMSIVTAVDVAACVIGCSVIFFLSHSIFRRNATRRTYYTSLSVFMLILTLALLINYYNGF